MAPPGSRTRYRPADWLRGTIGALCAHLVVAAAVDANATEGASLTSLRSNPLRDRAGGAADAPRRGRGARSVRRLAGLRARAARPDRTAACQYAARVGTADGSWNSVSSSRPTSPGTRSTPIP